MVLRRLRVCSWILLRYSCYLVHVCSFFLFDSIAFVASLVVDFVQYYVHLLYYLGQTCFVLPVDDDDGFLVLSSFRRDCFLL